MALKRFGEAITWCDKGLAVSFTHKLFFLASMKKNAENSSF